MVKKSLYLLISLMLLVTLCGCGSSGGGGDSGDNYRDNPVTPEQDLPTEYSSAPVFDKFANDIYNYNSNSNNVAIDLPVDSTYFVSITNTSPNPQSISLVSSVSASIRLSVTDEPQQSALANTIDSFRQQDQDEAKLQYRLNLFNRLRQKKNSNVLRSERAGMAGVDHRNEVVGQSYTILTSNLRGGYELLNNCKLVAETNHAKFFVDQNNRYGYSCHKELMEKIVTQGDFALTKVFESDTVNIYDFMTENFGDFFDVDNDKKVSVIITPYLSALSSSYLGLFMHECMLENFEDPRDQILIAPPINGQDSNYNKYEAVTNLCHEYQHLINFSQRFYRNGVYSFTDEDEKKYNYELFFDEGSSVCAEALFRRARGGDNPEHRTYPTLYDYQGIYTTEYTGNDKRFNDFFLSSDGCFKNVFPFYEPKEDGNSNTRYKKYGLNGLFLLYLHDRFGSENFKKLIQLPFTGNDLKTVIPQTLGTSLSLDELQRDWHLAMQHEYLLTEQKNNGEPQTNDVRFKYNDWLRLKSKNKSINTGNTYLEEGYSVLYKLKPETSNTGNKFRFFIKSTGNSTYKNLEINIIKL